MNGFENNEPLPESDPSEDKALLVTLQDSSLSDFQAQAHIEELEGLVNTVGIFDTVLMIVKHRENHAKYLIGSGKAEEIAEHARNAGANMIVFDDDLSPSQQRNWEEMSGLTVIDRQEVILEIFSQRALTREAVLQVGLARMEYSLPRLTRSYTHLSRQRGGARGNRGGGEMQLEVDRRVILKKIDKLKEELESVRAHRERTRSKRQESSLPTASIVGYTNAGKSTLLNRLADADVLEEDKLFATLDPTTRRTSLGQGIELLVTDTVGFIQKLPHHLVDAFRSTLEEAVIADFLIHVVDASHPQWEAQMATTRAVLGDLGSQDRPEILVFNKIDALATNPLFLRGLAVQYPEALFLSLRNGDGLEALKKELVNKVTTFHKPEVFHFPLDRGDLVGYLYKNAQVLSEEYQDERIAVRALVQEAFLGPVAAFRVGSTK